jgi:hypothetical protein
MRIARSTMKARLRPEGALQGPTLDSLVVARARQEALNRVCGEGCGACCGLSPIHGHEETGAAEFRCPLFEPQFADRVGGELLTQAGECGIPRLYAAVASGETAPEQVDAETIQAACPFLEVEG